MREISIARDAIVDYLQKELIGPRRGENEEVDEAPYKRYTAGTLYPRVNYSDSTLKDDEEDELSGVAGATAEKTLSEERGDDPIVLSNQYLPSSTGISFYLNNDIHLDIEITAGVYEEVKDSAKRKKTYKRIPLSSGQAGNFLRIEPHANLNYYEDMKLFDGRARLYVIWRPIETGWLVTATVINNNEVEGGTFEPQDCLHQVSIKCLPVGSGQIPAYPDNRLITGELEDQILDVIYRHNVTFGVGHGCSVDWTKSGPRLASEIHSEFMPAQEVFPITFKLEQEFNKVLSQYYLSRGFDYPEKMTAELERFVDAYRDWITVQIEKNTDISKDLSGARDTLILRMNLAADRMERGVSLLKQNENVRLAFCLANQAMLLQYIHAGKDFAGTRRPVGSKAYKSPKLSGYQDRYWRPFQLAYQLLTLSSVAFPDDPDREIVDLIWFPTGGGKTEAYLAVTAFQIFYRRLMHGDQAGGTTAIMRYTLRLLTTQQFQRAATLLCACELIRKITPELGKEKISIGLWVGEGTTPNSFFKAYEKYEELLKEEKPLSEFQIDRCPWCGTELVPQRKAANPDIYGFRSTSSSFSLFCPEKTCPFHEELPVAVVDEQLYRYPPTLLLATVDKFARITWEKEVQEFFGAGIRRPPELIIQDELHLISGPLGTIVGIYETAIDALASWNGIPPKILASTATIRSATDQCNGLYARPVELFPPSGLNAGDSYFSRIDLEASGRRYVGIMGQGHTGSTSMIRVSAALLQAPEELNLTGDSLDAYSTLVAYHNSLRELGKTLTFARDDIPARIKVIATDQKKLRDLGGEKVEELTSNITGKKLSGMLDRLGQRSTDKDSIAFLACSNMFSVGVDIQRLGLMLVNGQPKSTSEYIQSTSRVGRGVPGLVICLLSPSKPRDRSHYERFISYHAALYRHVEPTSVTPFAPPARDRAIHAVLVSITRHALGISENKDAKSFDADLPGLDRVVDYIVNRVTRIDPGEASETRAQIQDLIQSWEARAQKPDNTLVYSAGQTAKDSLLIDFSNKKKIGWKTLQSMRNVDRSCIIKIIEIRPEG